jgi:DNA-binding MarR family transcriptional regulator
VTETHSSEDDVTVLSDRVFDTLAALYASMRRDDVGRVAAGDTTWSQDEILAALIDHGPMRLGDLAALGWHQPASTTIAARRMQRKGLLCRVTDPSDGRVVLIALTSKGVATYRSSVARTRVKLAERLAAFTDDELHDVQTAVPVLAQIAEGRTVL